VPGNDLDLMVEGLDLDDIAAFIDKFGKKLEVHNCTNLVRFVRVR
jgi:hypothetical protein